MIAVITPLSDAAADFKAAADTLLKRHADSNPHTPRLTPPVQLVDGMQQFLSLTARIDTQDSDASSPDVSELGDFGIRLLENLVTWTDELGMPEAKQSMESMLLSACDWVITHKGEIHSLEPVANALASMANHAQDPQTLEQLALFVRRLVPAVDRTIRQDLEKTNLGRPWRIMLLNNGIVATRSHNPVVMEQAYDTLIQQLPEDAEQFFEEAMEQMIRLDYPPQVRAVVDRYYDRFARHSMH